MDVKQHFNNNNNKYTELIYASLRSAAGVDHVHSVCGEVQVSLCIVHNYHFSSRSPVSHCVIPLNADTVLVPFADGHEFAAVVDVMDSASTS